MIGLEVLMKQVRAMSTVTQTLGGHVSSMFAGMLSGQMASPLMHTQLVLGNIRLLASILKDAPDFDTFQHEITFGSQMLSDQEFWRTLYIDRERAELELAQIEQVVEQVREAIAQVQQELAMLRAVALQLNNLLTGVNQAADALVEARDLIERQVIPEVEQLLADLMNLLDRYTNERQIRDLKLWQQRHVFRFRFKLFRRLKIRRQKKLAEERAREAAEKAAREGKEDSDDDTSKANAEAIPTPETLEREAEALERSAEELDAEPPAPTDALENT